ncbi:hypothetical protein ABZ851_30715 [Streptomyces sp. NPDC047049]|uniref:hypothetical protein n=1 Tax=Streptomyces sp. NPDC047049 TaxID=3156688 RepID=UPI0033CD2FED
MGTLNLAGLALYMSMHETGALVVPYEVAQLRAEAISEFGYDGLRAQAFRRAWFSAVAEPGVCCDRASWARATASFVEDPA